MPFTKLAVNKSDSDSIEHLRSKALVVKNRLANSGDIRDAGLIPGWGRSPGGGHGNPLQYSSLENPMERGDWWATVHRVTKSWTPLKWLSTLCTSSCGIKMSCKTWVLPSSCWLSHWREESSNKLQDSWAYFVCFYRCTVALQCCVSAAQRSESALCIHISLFTAKYRD